MTLNYMEKKIIDINVHTVGEIVVDHHVLGCFCVGR